MNDKLTTMPESSNTILENIAGALVSGYLDDFPMPKQLNVHSLNYSVPSLNLVDSYLLKVRKNLPRATFFGRRSFDALPEPTKFALVVRLGAYVGEVIRRQSSEIFNWRSHAEILAQTPSHEGFLGSSADLMTSFGVVSDAGQIWLPLNKVFKFLVNGPEDSLAYFANVALSPHNDEQ